MNDRIVILCSYDGKINYLENNMPVYEGGTTRPLFITKSCTFDELVNELHKLTLTNSREYHLSVVCNYPVVENRTSGIQISSDYDMGLIHVLHDEKRSVELFIEKHQRDLGKSLNYEGMYSRMLEDPEVDSVGFLSPQQDECWTQSQYMSGPSFVGTSNAFDTNTGIQEDNASVESENDDEEEGLQINSMTVIDRDDGEIQHIDGAYVNNEYVGLEDPPPDELQGDEWIDNSAMESVPIGTNSGVDTQAEDFSFIKGDLYESKEKLIHAIRTYSIAKNVKFRPTKNNTTSYNVVCFYRKDDDVEDNSGHHDGNARCPWKLNSRSGSRVGGQFKITAYNGLHTCSNPRLEMNNKNASSSFIYRLILPHLREDLDLRPKDIRLLVHKATNLDVSYHKCWNARRKAMIKIFGDWDKSYEILPHYLEALKRENPGTVYEVSSDPVDGGERRFTGVFWAFGPCIEGFRYCRPLLSIDGTHLYGKYKGVLLVATGVDADGGLFPLAFAVVDVENTENWAWFFACIRYHIPSVGTRSITFISDRMKGIPRALQRHFPPPHAHRYCLRHIRDNFKKKYGNAQVQDLLWQAGCATEKYVYEQIRERIKFTSRAAHDWIETSLGPNNVDKWALCEDGGRRFCMMTTNASESFNGVLKGARGMPIQALVAKTFYRLNKFFVRRRELGENMRSQLTPKVDEMLAARIVQARSFQVVRYSFNEWEVLEGITHRENRSYKVNMLVDHTCTCTCNVPQLQLIPCSHVVAACSDLQGGARISHYEFVDACMGETGALLEESTGPSKELIFLAMESLLKCPWNIYLELGAAWG
ncbi:uncharacterized protein LOC109838151 [Asparagus officinalis]|uniref:uncharacterized protein LOC109838151 n=1 Tax=Asparagus officinalis TaxID=4686 RepID=UPI00098E5FB1|nr:uncharacterized protein LOC109838151 [Asparagus officinalis]